MKQEKNQPQNNSPQEQVTISTRQPLLPFSEKTKRPKSKRIFKNYTQKFQNSSQFKKTFNKNFTLVQQKQLPEFQEQSNPIQKQMRVYSGNRQFKQKIRISNGRIDNLQETQFRNIGNKLLKQTLKVNVDQNIMINILLEKSKYLKQALLTYGLTQQWFTKNIKNNKNFLNPFNSFLSKLIEKQQLNEDFRNIDKKVFQKIQKFCYKKIQSVVNRQEKQKTLNLKQTHIQQMITNRIQQLKKRLRQTENTSQVGLGSH